MWMKLWPGSILQKMTKRVVCNSFCKYLLKLPYPKFVQFWPIYQILLGFNFVELHKIRKCSKLIPRKKCLNQSKMLTIILNSDANHKITWTEQNC